MSFMSTCKPQHVIIIYFACNASFLFSKKDVLMKKRRLDKVKGKPLILFNKEECIF